ncbi:MAG TPA: permease-like cell division protein FtsX [Bacteroidales bacterium]|nr:permease-like cell division protein FtsX [Bacteroidales bacterium]HPS73030.1 permease-like cell division protein FtsX [Bacteroidales bacterium]
MAQREEISSRRRLGTSYVTTVISITLVLFMLGLLGMIILHTRKISNYVKENIGFSIILKDGVKESSIFQLKKRLDLTPYVKSAEYVTKEKAAEIFSEELGEDFVGFLGFNPLLPSIELRMKADYTNPDSVRKIETALLSLDEVKEVDYHRPLVGQINANVNRISMILLGFSAVLLLISMALINNTIRLAVYSKRFLLRSMQLVGATKRFIQGPFLVKGFAQGFISGLLAIGMLIGVLFLALQEMPELVEIQDFILLGVLFAVVLILGILISLFSTYFAVRKYMKMKTDLLYH